MATETYFAIGGKWRSFHTGLEVSGGTPPPSGTYPRFGINSYQASTTTAHDPAGETPAEQQARLLRDYGTMTDTKVFYTSGTGLTLPATYQTTRGEGLSTSPVCTVCFVWTRGQLAAGAYDSQIRGYVDSIPAGRTVRLTWNEIDNAISAGADWTAYRADMDHLYDLVTASAPASGGTCEVWECWMQYSLTPASGPKFSTTWTTPAKRHGIVWDLYWNRANTDKSGQTAIANILTAMSQLGMTRWSIGETGDRRPGTANSDEIDDSTRAANMRVRMQALVDAVPAPEGVVWFDNLGTTGDHRILQPDLGNDDLTKAMLKSFIDAGRAAH